MSGRWLVAGHGSQEVVTQERGAQPVKYITVGVGEPQAVDGWVVEEAQVCISVNGQELSHDPG